MEQVRNPIFTRGAFKWLHRPYSLFLCLTENLSGPSWPELASSGSSVRLLPRNGLDSLDEAFHFSRNYVTHPMWRVSGRGDGVETQTPTEHFIQIEFILNKNSSEEKKNYVLHSMIHDSKRIYHLCIWKCCLCSSPNTTKHLLIIIKRFTVSKLGLLRFIKSLFHQRPVNITRSKPHLVM